MPGAARLLVHFPPFGLREGYGMGIVYREVECKTVLNRSKLGDYSLNCYGGCAHACAYCYARYMERFRPHAEPWGQFVDIKVNAPDVLLRQAARMTPGEVFVSSACDAWQPVEAARGLTRECCRILLAHNFNLYALTKSDLILRDFDVFAMGDVCVGTTVTTLDERLAALWEPGAAPVARRLEVLRRAHEAGFRTSVMFGPLLPFLSDNLESLRGLLSMAADLQIDTVYVDIMNPRANVWPSVSALLGREFPDLVERYQAVLFWSRPRAAYVAALHERVETICRDLHIPVPNLVP